MSSLTAFLITLRNRHFFLIDALILLVAPPLALFLRLENSPNLLSYADAMLVYTFVSGVISLSIFYALGLYGRYWRYASVDDMFQIGEAAFFSFTAVSVAFFALRRPGLMAYYDSIPIVEELALISQLPRSIPLIAGLIIFSLVGLSRFVIRFADRRQRLVAGQATQRRVLIMGAGEAGHMIARELERNSHLGMTAVGFVDDDPSKHGLRILGLPVFGGREFIPRAVRQERVKQAIIAMPTASGKTIREIALLCAENGLQTKTIPGIYELLDGSVSVKRLRDIQIEDLLRREPVRTDTVALRTFLQGKRVLVTGGGGSIGGELCRQIIRCFPAELIIIGHGENSVFLIEKELSDFLDNLPELDGGANAAQRNGRVVPPPVWPIIRAVIADIRFPERINAIFQQYKPEVVFHAAAHKHVPLMESNPGEAVTNNIGGTRNLLEAALSVSVGHFVMISTDKAVNPTSVMGASKRVAELLVHEAAERSGLPYVAVRFGNVLGSRGSVVLTFQRQIALGGPVTVTHPDMRRYFMTIPEAVQLVLQAAALGSGGEVFVLDMGDPIKISDLAQDMIALSGLKLGEDIDIQFSGMRPGEKLFEELFTQGEEHRQTAHEKIFIAANASQFVPHNLANKIADLEDAAWRGDNEAIIRGLEQLIPEFESEQSVQP